MWWFGRTVAVSVFLHISAIASPYDLGDIGVGLLF
jgi:hypothetical protein